MATENIEVGEDIQGALRRLESKGGVLRLAPGDHRLKDVATYESKHPLAIEGYGRIICEKSGFNITSDSPVSISNITLASSGQGTHTALSLTGDGNLGRGFTLENVSLGGVGLNSCWKTGIKMVRGSWSRINGLWVLGHTGDLDKMVNAIDIHESTDVKIRDGWIYWTRTGLQVTGQSEGIVFQGNHVVPCHVGVSANTTVPGNYLDISDNHINAQSSGVMLRGTNHSQVNHNLIFKNRQSDIGFVGIDLGAHRCSVVGNEVMKKGGGSENGIVVRGSYNRIGLNGLADQQTGVFLTPTSSHNLVLPNVGLNLKNTLVVDRGENNTVVGT